MMHIRTLARRILGLWHDVAVNTRGASLVMVAVTAPALVGFLGVGVETGLWYYVKRQAQTAADTGAIAGALERSTGNPSNVVVAAKRESQRNGFNDASPNTVVVHNPPMAGPNSGNPTAVEVIVSHRPTLLFARLFIADTQIMARAVAQVHSTGTACVLALKPTASIGIKNMGSTNVDLLNCTMAANSTSETAITIGGSSTVRADSLWTPGNYDNFGSGNLTLTHPAATNVWPLDDPYKSLTIPTLGACNYTNKKWNSGTHTASPGVYCGGMDFGSQAKVNMNPGVYYLNRGDFNVNAQVEITCNCVNPTDGVSIILTSSGATSEIGHVTINGGALIDLRAPSADSAPYKGVLMYQDRRAPADGNNKLNGGSALNLTGALYFPAQNVDWQGNNVSNASSCTQIVANTIVFTGNSVIQDAGCLAYGVIPIAISDIRVVE